MWSGRLSPIRHRIPCSVLGGTSILVPKNRAGYLSLSEETITWTKLQCTNNRWLSFFPEHKCQTDIHLTCCDTQHKVTPSPSEELSGMRAQGHFNLSPFRSQQVCHTTNQEKRSWVLSSFWKNARRDLNCSTLEEQCRESNRKSQSWMVMWAEPKDQCCIIKTGWTWTWWSSTLSNIMAGFKLHDGDVIIVVVMIVMRQTMMSRTLVMMMGYCIIKAR